jgi:hypothetical protein
MHRIDIMELFRDIKPYLDEYFNFRVTSRRQLKIAAHNGGARVRAAALAKKGVAAPDFSPVKERERADRPAPPGERAARAKVIQR